MLAIDPTQKLSPKKTMDSLVVEKKNIVDISSEVEVHGAFELEKDFLVGDISIPLIVGSHLQDDCIDNMVDYLGDLEFSTSQWNKLGALWPKGSLASPSLGKITKSPLLLLVSNSSKFKSSFCSQCFVLSDRSNLGINISIHKLGSNVGMTHLLWDC